MVVTAFQLCTFVAGSAYIFFYFFFGLFSKIESFFSEMLVGLLGSSCSFYSGKGKNLAAVQETENSSAWNHIFKLQRRDPPRRRTRKMLSLWHAHGSAPRSSYPVCQTLARWKHSELGRKTNCPQEKKGGRRSSIGFVVGTFGNFSFSSWAVQHRCIGFSVYDES